MRLILLILVTPIILFAQKNKHEIKWIGNFQYESNSLNNSFLNHMLYGGKISNNIKSEWINSAYINNIIFLDISNKLSYKYHFKKNTLGFSISDINILNANFTDDLLRLTLQGNFQSQGETLNFTKTSIRVDRYQQYKITYSRNIKNINLNGGVSYLSGNHHLSYIIEKGSLYTAPFGSYLDIEYSMHAFATDTSDFSAFTNNGNGIAMDFGVDFKMEKYKMHFSIINLGFINWNKSSIITAVDSTFNFQGIEVDDIFNFNDSILEANNFIDDITKTNNNSFKSYVPATLHIALSVQKDYKYLKNYTLGIIAKWQPYMDNKPLSIAKIHQGINESNFTPLYYVNSKFYLNNFLIKPTLSYGGYSQSLKINDPSIGFSISKGKKYIFTIGTFHLEDIFNDKARSAGVYFNIQLQL